MSDHPRYLHSAAPTVRSLFLTFAAFLIAGATADSSAQEAEDGELPTIEEKTEGMMRFEGFVPLYWDETDGKLWLEFSRFGEEFLHYVSLPAGIGSNDIGLDRGQLGPRSVVKLERVGRRILMVEPNYEYRASTENPLERRSVEQAFASSVLWGFEMAAETGVRTLVDATDFIVREDEGQAALPGRVKRLLQRTRRHQLYLHLVATLYRAAKETNPELADGLIFATPKGDWDYVVHAEPTQKMPGQKPRRLNTLNEEYLEGGPIEGDPLGTAPLRRKSTSS